MRRSLLVVKPVLFVLVAALGLAAQAADPSVSTSAGVPDTASSAGTVFHYQVLPAHSPQSYGHVASRSVNGRTAVGKATLSDSYKDSLVSSGTGADKFTDVFPSTSVAIAATIPLGVGFDFTTVDDSTPVSLDAGGVSFSAALGDADRLNLNGGVATFLVTADVTNDRTGDTKTVKVGTVALKWNRRTAMLTIKATQKVSGKQVAQGADQGATIVSPPGEDGPFIQDVGLAISFGDASVDLTGTMSGTQKTVTKRDGTELVNAHAKGRAQ